jgi:hypothetical protein
MGSNMGMLLNRLSEIRVACAIAASMEDVNINQVIEEISSLASHCISNLTQNN